MLIIVPSLITLLTHGSLLLCCNTGCVTFLQKIWPVGLTVPEVKMSHVFQDACLLGNPQRQWKLDTGNSSYFTGLKPHSIQAQKSLVLLIFTPRKKASLLRCNTPTGKTRCLICIQEPHNQVIIMDMLFSCRNIVCHVVVP